MEPIIDGLVHVFHNLHIVPIGVLLGMVIGGTPGLTSSNSIPILFPILITMPPETGLILGVSIYTGAEMGNSFPAVLLNIPGNASSVVTTFDGYPMTRSGQAARALGICIMASFIGAIFGGIASISMAHLISLVALKFSPVEMCIVIIFGLVIIAQVSGESVVKGLLSGFFGLLLATTGTDPIWGQFRGTFGSKYLIDGLPIIPVLIGLLAFSEILNISTKISEETRRREQDREKLTVAWRDIFVGFQDVIRRWGNWIRSGIIGVIVGIIPGAGTSIASFISYQQAYSFAGPKEKERFGKGSPDGLMSGDVANNSMIGGSLVPLLTLGIPGSGTMAVLMVLMSYHGLHLGPRFFSINGDIAYAVLWSQFVAAFGILIIGMLLANLAYKLAYIKIGIILPTVTILCIIGGYAYNEYIFDIWLVIGFGIIGFIMKKYDYIPVAMLLGVILGPMFEKYFFQGLKMGFGSPLIFFTRPLAIFLWVLLVMSVLVSPTIKYFSKGKENIKDAQI